MEVIRWLLCTCLAGVAIGGLASGGEKAAEEQVLAFVRMLDRRESGQERQRLRNLLVDGDEDVARAVGRVFAERKEPGVRNELANVLSEMKCDRAGTVLQSLLSDGSGGLPWMIAAALARRQGAVVLSEGVQQDLFETLDGSENMVRVEVSIQLLSRQVGLDVPGLVSRIIERLRGDRSEGWSEERFRVLGDGAEIVRAAAAALSGEAKESLAAARKLQEEGPREGWTVRGRRLVTMFRALLGDAGTKKSVLAYAADEEVDPDIRLLALREIPELCGEEGRRTLETVASSVPPSPAAGRTVEPDGRAPRERVIAETARDSLRRLDKLARSKEDRGGTGEK